MTVLEEQRKQAVSDIAEIKADNKKSRDASMVAAGGAVTSCVGIIIFLLEQLIKGGIKIP